MEGNFVLLSCIHILVDVLNEPAGARLPPTLSPGYAPGPFLLTARASIAMTRPLAGLGRELRPRFWKWRSRQCVDRVAFECPLHAGTDAHDTMRCSGENASTKNCSDT